MQLYAHLHIFVLNGNLEAFPSWLLREPIHIRRNETAYLEHVADYYDVLMKRIVSPSI